MCTLYIPEEDKVVSVASEHLEPVVPQKGNRVRTTYYYNYIPTFSCDKAFSKVLYIIKCKRK